QAEKRWRGWHKRRPSQSQYTPQLEWEAHVVEYVNWAYQLTKSNSGPPKPLKAEVPLLGPRFLPPTYLHCSRRNSIADIQPETSYMRPLTIIHPLYFEELAKCPR
ncbi:uncharacterized protein TRAVEDRAFT_97136, partial [Trametes versicolor FP-101664 SS1]|uniref:uncharacterized protein n=1 Tax=Trametes versicolor (strain FP-101664) TaxID=717944 RepID=UPI000462332B